MALATVLMAMLAAAVFGIALVTFSVQAGKPGVKIKHLHTCSETLPPAERELSSIRSS